MNMLEAAAESEGVVFDMWAMPLLLVACHRLFSRGGK
jgi:hypothetical protein